jgi:hypothetical protein
MPIVVGDDEHGQEIEERIIREFLVIHGAICRGQYDGADTYRIVSNKTRAELLDSKPEILRSLGIEDYDPVNDFLDIQEHKLFIKACLMVR